MCKCDSSGSKQDGCGIGKRWTFPDTSSGNIGNMMLLAGRPSDFIVKF